MREVLKILGVKIDKVKMEEAVLRVRELITRRDETALVVTPNSEMLAMAAKDPELARILNSAQLATADGAGVVMAAKILGDSLPERVAGFDLICSLFLEFAGEDVNFYFLGGKPGVVDQALKKLKADPNLMNLNVVGYHHGYLDQDNQKKVIDEINSKDIDILLVGMGVPLQEKFLDNNLEKLDVRAAITVGGSFDVLAGRVKRAPVWLQKASLEWFYRLLQEPSRFGRMLLLPKFIYLVIKSRFNRNN